MVQDSADRLEKIMGKLYRSPRPRQSALSWTGLMDATSSKGMPLRDLAPRAQVGKVLPCRPWDRSDLIRRLTTFKAMTWFGKPKNINPLSCARRGWINVEMDVIVCEVCGARLLFATPPMWPLQQVEKAAAVFSLKLDNGHKLLCPWINNACDESLACFPPSTPQALVEGFKERSHALLRFTALPVISSLATDYMKSPQLDHFLSVPVRLLITLNGVRLIDDFKNNHLDSATEDDISHGYYQSLNIISLCGWEPRSLPYTVDVEAQLDPSTKSTNPHKFSKEIPSEEQPISICSSRSHNDVEEMKDNYLTEYLYDPSSTVLDCRFCGACVGLWFFNAIPRPLEFFKVIIDTGRQNQLAIGTADLPQSVEAPNVVNFGREDQTSKTGKQFDLQLSIAGGPSPNNQHFRPKVSFPVISRHLRADLLYKYCLRCMQATSGNEDHVCHQKELKGHHDDDYHAVRTLKRKQSEVEGSNTHLHVEGNHSEVDIGLVIEDSCRHTTEEIPTSCTDMIARDTAFYQIGSPTNDVRELDSSVSRLLDERICGHSEHDHCDHSLARLDESNSGHHCDPCLSASSSVTNVNSAINSNSCEKAPFSSMTTEQESVGKEVAAGSAKDVSVFISSEKDAILSDKSRQTAASYFDPIKQHRPFCPWIFEEGKHPPGWKTTLSALINLENLTSQPPEPIAAASNLLEEAEDPIVSVRKLFMSPQSKRLKGSQ